MLFYGEQKINALLAVPKKQKILDDCEKFRTAPASNDMLIKEDTGASCDERVLAVRGI